MPTPAERRDLKDDPPSAQPNGGIFVNKKRQARRQLGAPAFLKIVGILHGFFAVFGRARVTAVFVVRRPHRPLTLFLSLHSLFLGLGTRFRALRRALGAAPAARSAFGTRRLLIAGRRRILLAVFHDDFSLFIVKR